LNYEFHNFLINVLVHPSFLSRDTVIFLRRAFIIYFYFFLLAFKITQFLFSRLLKSSCRLQFFSLSIPLASRSCHFDLTIISPNCSTHLDYRTTTRWSSSALHRPLELNRPWIFSFLYPRPSQLQGTSFSIILLSDLHRKNTADGGNLSDRKQNCGIWVSLLPVYSLSLEYWIVDRYYRRYISSLSFFALLLIQMIAKGGTEERCDLRKKVFVFPIRVGAVSRIYYLPLVFEAYIHIRNFIPWILL